MSMTGDENLKNEIPMNFIAARAKWDLINIFNDKLESPDSINELIIWVKMLFL